MDYSTLLIMLLLFIVIYSSYSAHSLKDKIRCTFRRRDRTRLERFAKAKQKRIDFDNGWYYINPKYTTLSLWSQGVHAIIPTWIRVLDFRHDSPEALNPDTFTNSWESPEARKALNKEEDIRAYSAGNVASLAKSKPQGMLDRFFPIIVIGAVCAIGYMLYSLSGKVDMLGQAVNTLQKMMMGQ